ncbi:MAG TPA: hypothetical protein VJB57_13625 [Dehalococcoidia bacterium]|nr:hypothetical protein [Dehalococcoidia bacterium]
MSRIIWPSIAATCVAIYFISRKRKVEIDLETEPIADSEARSDSNGAHVALMAE